MLEALKFVRGSIAKKDFIPALTNFVIENSLVRGFNGTIALCSPIPFDIACKPKAVALIDAIGNCEDTIQLSMTPKGKLTVKSGGFKVHIECVEGDTLHPWPEGQFVQFDGEALMTGIKAVAPFMSDDASRRWFNGILIEDKSLFATNNVIAGQYWLGSEFPSVVIPRPAVVEMLRIGQAPLYAQVTERSVTFHYEGERWLKTQLYDKVSWPNISKLLDFPSNQQPLDPLFAKALPVLKKFLDKVANIYFIGNKLTTHSVHNIDEGGSYEVGSELPNGCYAFEMLEILVDSAAKIDWSTYPKPCAFSNGRLRGAIVGRLQP